MKTEHIAWLNMNYDKTTFPGFRPGEHLRSTQGIGQVTWEYDIGVFCSQRVVRMRIDSKWLFELPFLLIAS